MKVRGTLTEVYLDEDGIVRSSSPEEITDEEARNAIEKTKELLEKIPFEKRRVLVDFRKTRRGSLSARKAYLEATELIPKGAVLVSNIYQKIVVSLVLRAGSVSQKIKIFTDEGEALRWLKR